MRIRLCIAHYVFPSKPAAVADFDAVQIPFTQPPPYGRGRYTKVLGNLICSHKATVVGMAMDLLSTPMIFYPLLLYSLNNPRG